ncbi:hypothetical protein CFP56_009071, partial [Quercus suber]
TDYKSKEKQKDFGHHPHHLLNLWSPFKLKTQSVSAVALLMGLLGMVYQGKKQLPSPPTPSETSETGSPEDSPEVSSRFKLKDGRYLAYRERGVAKDKAKFKIILVHGLGSSKEMNFLAPQELIDELGIYFLLFDRAGYGESDADPKHSVKSEAFDIQELADHLQLAGVSFVVPVVNYWWRSLPDRVIKDDYRKKLVRWSMWFANHAPGLLHWWVNQKWLPSTSVLERNPVFFNDRDIDVLKTISGFPMLTQDKLRERSVFDTLRRDFMLAFGKWEFDPLDLRNPYPQNESTVHIWQGFEDKVVPVQLQRFVSGKLPWIRYHEVPNGGHLIVHYDGICEAILRSLLLGEEQVSFRPNTAIP